jgi:GNAT superfamily N-acetyltransferase
MERSTDALRIRDATLDDGGAIARLMGVLGYPVSPESMRARLERLEKHFDYRTMVAIVDGEVRGFAGLHRTLIYELDPPIVQLLAIAVEEAWQGRGIGTALTGEAEAWARRQGAAGVTLHSGHHRQSAHRFYERRGYETTGFGFVKRLNS